MLATLDATGERTGSGGGDVTFALHALRAGYGRTAVVKDVDLALGPGFHVLLGANGAGKTTLFRVGAGVLPPQAGEVRVLGHDPYRTPDVKRLVGYLPHRPTLYPGLTARDNLEFWTRVLRFSPAERHNRIEQVVADLKLDDMLSRPAGALSRGQSQRVAVARALLADPAVLFLDEPTTGLDPSAARDVRELLKGLARGKRTLIYSTHNLYEAAELAEDVILYAAGKIMAQGPLETLRQRFVPQRRLGLKVSGDPQSVLRGLGYTPGREGEHWVVELRADEEAGHIVNALVQAGLPVLEVREMGNPLESIYFGMERELHNA